jgi:hypothetical protein
VPAGALTNETTIRVAMDSTGAPALPSGLTAAGNTYVITPHGGEFAKPIEVRIPAPALALQPTQQLKLAKAQPGGEWLVLSDTELTDGVLSARVESFSFFTAIVITYPLPILQAEPLQLTASLTCGDQPCDAALGNVTATYTVTSNNGQTPAICPTYDVGIATTTTNFFEREEFPIPLTGGSLTRTVSPGPYHAYYFSAIEHCGGGGAFNNFGRGWIRTVEWAKGPAYPGISVLSMPPQLDVLEGRAANLDVVLGGGASRSQFATTPEAAFSAPTRTDRAIIDWQRSDDGGASWRDIARSFQNEGNPLPFGTGQPWRQWSVRHGFIATATRARMLHTALADPAGAVRDELRDATERTPAERVARHRQLAALGADSHRADRKPFRRRFRLARSEFAMANTPRQFERCVERCHDRQRRNRH